jgi:hypothetical protein
LVFLEVHSVFLKVRSVFLKVRSVFLKVRSVFLKVRSVFRQDESQDLAARPLESPPKEVRQDSQHREMRMKC